MLTIIAGTNRPDSRSLEVARLIEPLYTPHFDAVKIMSVADVGLEEVNGSQYSENKPTRLKACVDQLNRSQGLVIVCPEYNGSLPGALKYFIDHWDFPKTFEHRPVALIGLGGLFGGLRPVEHLQQILGYRNAHIYPDRVFMINVWEILKDQKCTDKVIWDLLQKQAQGFSDFVKRLKT